MAVKLAQTKTGTSTLAASTAIVWDNSTVAGNLIIVAVISTSTTINSVSSVTDSQSNIYTRIFSNETNGNLGDVELWYAKNILGGSTPTVTVNYGATLTSAVIIREYSGLDTLNPLSQSDGSASGNNNSPTSNTIKTIQFPCLLIGIMGQVGVTGSISAGGSYVNLATASNGNEVAIEDLSVTSVGSYNATFSDSLSLQWECGIVAFCEAPHGTTTSTSSTSSTSSSTSSTSTSISSISTSSTSTSYSSTSTSLSTSSTSLSTSSTSSSISSTSSSISSTSTSSTSSSTSLSSTSSSISSTSVSSTSQSSTSSSTSYSSISTSFSSTSSSQSSTSASTSSTSASSTSSSSSTSTTAIPLNLDYTYEDKLTLPATGADLTNRFNVNQVSDVTGDDGDYFIEYGSEVMIRNYQFDNTNNTDTPTFTWRGRTTYDTRISPVLIQIYNVNSATWETLATANTVPADTDFSITVSQTTNVSNYYDSSNIVTFRSYQKVI